MQQFLLGFYVLFFATGFMGATALFLLAMRVRSRVVRILLAFQLIFLPAMALVLVYIYLAGTPGGIDPGVATMLEVILAGLNAVLFALVFLSVRRVLPPSARRRKLPAVAEILAGLVVVRSVVNMVLVAAAGSGEGLFPGPAGMEAWMLGGLILTGLAMATFGVTVRGPFNPQEPRTVRPLVRAYGLCTIVFAPTGLVEYAIASAGLPWLPSIQLDHLFYLTWNIISMSAAIRIFRPGEQESPTSTPVPRERIAALNLSAREVEMAVLIGRGLSNKQIAAELFISPATVRTHIYNLYQKTGAGNRVELLNKLRE
jgi:DNA-binding CsgD family transcriptional regulator